MLAPYVGAVQEAILSFESAPIAIGDSQETWHIYQSAAQVCKKRYRGAYGYNQPKHDACLVSLVTCLCMLKFRMLCLAYQ